SAGMTNILTYVANLTSPAAYAAALDRLSPEGYLAQPTATVMTGMAFLDSMMSCHGSAGPLAPIREQSCVWAKFTGGSTKQDATPTAMNYDDHGTRYQAGMQAAFAPGWFLGFGMGYEAAHTQAGNFTSTDAERHDIGIALKHSSGPWLLALALD